MCHTDCICFLVFLLSCVIIILRAHHVRRRRRAASTHKMLDEIDLKGESPERKAKREEMLYSKHTFGNIGVKIVPSINYTKNDCGLVYTYLPPDTSFTKVIVPTKFQRDVQNRFKAVTDQLSRLVNFDWRSMNVVHYRRGDKLSGCETVETRLNCKNITDFVKYIRQINGDGALYVATNEVLPSCIIYCNELCSTNSIIYSFRDRYMSVWVYANFFSSSPLLSPHHFCYHNRGPPNNWMLYKS